jgi:hypothetical protein
MEWNTMEEYLIRIGADIDQNSFSAARSALSDLKGLLSKLKGAAAPLALASAIGAIGKAAYDTVKGVAKADMEYTKLAASMWTTKETAKALSVAMKTMGVSQEDLAWVPELREQFFRLREEINRFATPEDADAQLRYIREIGYDIQTLFVRLKMLKEWIAYYLIRYLEPYIKDFKAFINWLLDKLGEDLPGLARKVARAMSTVLSPVLATIKVLGMAIGKFYDFIVSLPDNVKKWGAIFAAVGAVIMSGPFGLMIAGLSAAMLLLEDFVGYMNGWDSSADLAPIWEALLKFSEGTGSEWMQNFKQVLTEIADILDKIFNGIKLNEVLDEARKNANKLWTGVSNLAKSLKKVFDEMDKGKPKVKDFWGVFGEAIGTVLKMIMRVAGSLGDLIDSVSSYMDGDKTAGRQKLENAIGTVLGSKKRYDDNVNGIAREAWKEAQRIGADLNVDPALIYGQWYHETGGFSSRLTKENYNLGGLTQVTPNGEENKQPDGGNYYMQFDSIRAYADYYKRIWGPYIQGSKSAEDYASRLKSEGYYGDSYENYVRGLHSGMQHIPMSHESENTKDAIAATSESSAAVNGSATDKIAAGMLDGIGLKTDSMSGEQEMGTAPLQNAMPNAQESAAVNGSATDKIAAGMLDGIGLKTGFMPGEQEMAMSPLDGIFKALQRPTEFKPNIQIPQMGMPDINIPEMRMPPFPDVKIPDIRIPDINIPQMQIPKIDIPVMTVADNSYAAGRDETPILPQAGGGTSNSYAIDMGTPVININVAGSNASPKEIAGAVKDGMSGWLDSALMNIQARNMRRPVV